MSPFRKMLAARGVRHPAVYSILMVMLGMLTSAGVAVGFSIDASNRAIDRAIEAERRADAERESAKREVEAENRAASCQFINTILNAYREDAPTTPSKTYQNIVDAWASLAERCK